MSQQEAFEREYVTSAEVCRRVGVTRSALPAAKTKGWLPEPIVVENQFHLWRREIVEPYIETWAKRRKERIGVA